MQVRVSLVALLAAAAAAAEPLPEPGQVDSHSRYVEALREEQASRAAELLARYDRRLAEAPEDAVAAVERCRFLGLAFYDPETEENSREEERLDCIADVERRFAGDPGARVFVVEERWGDEAREAAEAFLAEPPAAAQPQHLAAVHAHLARVGETAEWDDAASHAEQAMALDPSLDLRLQVARSKQWEGDDEGARAVLLEGLLETETRWVLEQKAALLVELEAFDDALAAFREAERREGEAYHHAEYARALVAKGEIAAARAAWAKSGEGWLNDEDLRARFEFELAHGDAETGRAAYDALRERGWEQDPVGRDRLALYLAHPDAPWTWQDAWPLGVLAFAFFFASLLPALFILPIAWAGLARQGRAAAATPGFGLHHAWTVSALVLLAEVVAAVTHLDGFAEESADRAVLARYAVVGSVASLGAVLLVVRGRAFDLLRRGSWSWRRTVLAAVLGTLGLRFAMWLVEQATGSSGGDAITEEMVRSVSDHYGLDASLFAIAMLTPITEELAFRGVMLSAFAGALGPRWGNFAQAALFGLAHAHPIVTPYTFAMGLLAGWMTRRSGTLWPALGMHAFNNALACAALAASAA